jgi:protein TonB
VNETYEEPSIPAWLRRPLAAVWISLGLHAALIALVQVAPPASPLQVASVIEARLVPTQAALPEVETPPPVPAVEVPDDTPKEVPLLAPSKTAEALPVATPLAEPVPTVVAAPSSGPPAEPRPAATPPAAPAPEPEATITSSVDLTYYSARDVDTQPRALREIVPDYPASADRQRLSGKVRLQLKLEADGRVIDIEVVSATPPDVFDESALRAFREARFAPAQKNGRPVRALVLIEVVYDWEGRR